MNHLNKKSFLASYFISIIKVVILSSMGLSSIEAYESPDAFIVKVFDEKVRVLSPKKDDPHLSVIIENKTQVTLRGKVETESGGQSALFTLDPHKMTHVKLENLKKERIFFIPLSPPLQKVELKLGNKPYEIPPRS